MRRKIAKLNVELDYIPFARMQKSGLALWRSAKASKYLPTIPVQTVYIHRGDLEECARCDKHTIWYSQVGFMSNSWVNEYKGKTAYDYKFATGIYVRTDSLLLVEDLFKWIHRGLPESKIRSAEDIIEDLKKSLEK